MPRVRMPLSTLPLGATCKIGKWLDKLDLCLCSPTAFQGRLKEQY